MINDMNTVVHQSLTTQTGRKRKMDVDQSAEGTEFSPAPFFSSPSDSKTTHDAFVTAANAVGQLYSHAMQQGERQRVAGAREALLKLFSSLPEGKDESVSVAALKMYITKELESLLHNK
jgi:hypothetical protein